MLLRQDLDEIYAAFCKTLPYELRAVARDLPFRLRMASAPGVPWSEVFAQEVTFAAPALFAQAMPQISPAKVRDAVLAHVFAVIDAFGTDRIEDRQIEASPDLEEILARVRRASELALVRVGECLGDAGTDYARAQRAMLQAILGERKILSEDAPIGFDLYESIALAKAGIGNPASIVLARAAGWNAAECQAVAKTLDSVWLGLQLHDDVIDWEDDFKRGSSWAARLAPGCASVCAPSQRMSHQNEIREQVLESGILAKMLSRSSRNFHAAHKRAEALGARELAAWARSKEEHASSLAQSETRSSGYAVRLHRLSPWVAQVLS